MQEQLGFGSHSLVVKHEQYILKVSARLKREKQHHRAGAWSCSSTSDCLSQWGPDPDSNENGKHRLILCKCAVLGALRERRWHDRLD